MDSDSPDSRVDDPLPSVLANSSVYTFAGTQAGFWERLAAFIVDLVLATVAVALFTAIFSTADEAFAAFAASLGYFGYFTVLVATKGTTVGKSFLKLYVVRTDGSRVGIIRAFFRSVAQFVVLAIAWGTLLGVFFLILHYRKSRRAVHDAICDTIVVKSDRHLF